MRSTDADGLADSRRRCRDGFLPVRGSGRRGLAAGGWMRGSLSRSELLASLRSVVAGTVAGDRRRPEAENGRRARLASLDSRFAAGSRDVRWGLRRAGGDAQTRGVSSVRFRA